MQKGQSRPLNVRNLLTGFLPLQPAAPPVAILRAGAGAAIGIAATGALATWWWGSPIAVPLLIAPMGASSVLLFAVPASPLAQPYALIGGNLLSAIVGVTAAHLIGVPLIAGAAAVSFAIMAMALFRCVHPPSGAVALTAVLGGPKVLAAGYGFVAAPVLLNTLILLGAAIAWHRLSGISYPHAAHPPARVPEPSTPHRPTSADFEAAIANYGEALAIDARDLAVLYDGLMRISGPRPVS